MRWIIPISTEKYLDEFDGTWPLLPAPWIAPAAVSETVNTAEPSAAVWTFSRCLNGDGEGGAAESATDRQGRQAPIESREPVLVGGAEPLCSWITPTTWPAVGTCWPSARVLSFCCPPLSLLQVFQSGCRKQNDSLTDGYDLRLGRWDYRIKP